MDLGFSNWKMTPFCEHNWRWKTSPHRIQAQWTFQQIQKSSQKRNKKLIYIIFSNFRDFVWHSFIAYTVCTIFEILTHCKIQQTDLKPQQRWESPMKWKYDHIWIDWFLLGVRPHKQNTMGCQQQQIPPQRSKNRKTPNSSIFRVSSLM